MFSVPGESAKMLVTLRCSFELFFFKKTLENILEKICVRRSSIAGQKVNLKPFFIGHF